MKKRGNQDIGKYISSLIKTGHSRQSIIQELDIRGFDRNFVDNTISAIYKKRILTYSFVMVILLIGMFFIVLQKPIVTGFATADASYPAVKFASADYNSNVGLIYQGVGTDNKEHIYKDNSELSIQGKQHGSVNIVYYDGAWSLFTTGYYTDANDQQIASTDLYKGLNQKVPISFINVKNSDSCWGNWQGNGFYAPVIIGSDDQGKQYFEVYKNVDGQITDDYSLGGVENGKVNCIDINGDFFTDLVVCGKSSGTPITRVYMNNNGKLQESQSLEGLWSCDISFNIFPGDNNPDFISAGITSTGNYAKYFNKNNGGRFSSSIIDDSTQIRDPSLSSADIFNSGNIDFAISGRLNGDQSTSLIYDNTNGQFSKDDLSLTQLRDGAILFYNKDNKLFLFQTGEEKQGPTTSQLITQLMSDFTTIPNSPPTIPSNLTYEKNNTRILFIWNISSDDHTLFPSYQIKVSDDSNFNLFLTSYFNYLSLPNPCNNNIDKFYFQVQSIDGAYAQSAWSDKFYINCNTTAPVNLTANLTNINQTNTTQILNQTNTTLPPVVNLTTSITIRSKPIAATIFLDGTEIGSSPVKTEITPGIHIINATANGYVSESKTITITEGQSTSVTINLEQIFQSTSWPDKESFGPIQYSATYDRTNLEGEINSADISQLMGMMNGNNNLAGKNYILITETVTNTGSQDLSDVQIWHGERNGVLSLGPYNFIGNNRFAYSIGLMPAGSSKQFSFRVDNSLPDNNILTTGVDYNIVPPQAPKPVQYNITPNVTTTQNTTTIQIPVNTNITGTGVKVTVNIPPCLLARVNQMAIDSGIITSNQQFTIEKEEPVMAFYFANVIEPTTIKLEIKKVAEENCTNEITADAVAQKVFLENEKFDYRWTIIGLAAPILLIFLFLLFLNQIKDFVEDTRKNLKFRQFAAGVLFLLSLSVLIYNWYDAISALHPAPDYIKKLMSFIGTIMFFSAAKIFGLFTQEKGTVNLTVTNKEGKTNSYRLQEKESKRLENGQVITLMRLVSYLRNKAHEARLNIYSPPPLPHKEAINDNLTLVEGESASLNYLDTELKLQIDEIKEIQGYKSARIFSFFLILGCLLMSMKNLVFSSYDIIDTKWFHDSAGFVVLHSGTIVPFTFFLGTICLFIAIFTAWFSFDLKNFVPKNIKNADIILKLLITSLLVFGFFIVIFNNIFDAFSVGLDSPFLFFLCLIFWKSFRVTEAQEREESVFNKFLSLFTDPDNRPIALSAIPMIIVGTECFSYYFYFLGRVTNMYISSLPTRMPNLYDILWHFGFSVILIPYILQVFGLIAISYLAFQFWLHFYRKRKKDDAEATEKIENPRHPYAFALLIGGLLSFLLSPVFSFLPLSNIKVAGTLMEFQYIGGITIWQWLLPIIAAIAVFILLKDKKIKHIILFTYPVLIFIMAVTLIKYLHGTYLMTIANLTAETSSIFAHYSAYFLSFLNILYIVILTLSFYFVLAEFFSLLEEDYGHRIEFRMLVRAFFKHKAKLTSDHHKEIRAHYEIHKTNADPVGKVVKSTGFSREEITKSINSRSEQSEPDELTKYIRTAHHIRKMPIESIKQNLKMAGYSDEHADKAITLAIGMK